MNIVYNTQKEITSGLREFFRKNTTVLHKPQLNFLPEVIFGMIQSESVVCQDNAFQLKDQQAFAQLESIQKRFSRMMKNPRFKGMLCFDEVIKYIIKNLKLKHEDKRVHIIIDHMYSRENYTILMASMRVGRQGIPICFKVFDGINNSEAYLDTVLIELVNKIHNIFKDYDFGLIFLADRWFNSYELLNAINELGHTYVIRLKGNLNIKVFVQKEGHKIRKQTDDLFAYQFHSCYYENVELYENHDFTTHIVRSKKDGVKEPWILATNGAPKRAVKDYGYRYGGIETIFKNQKSNCFYLEDIVNASILYFENLYATLCISICLLTCLGAEYSKNAKCYKNVKIQTHKRTKSAKIIRVMSIFKTGLTLFKLAINSLIYIRLPLNFKLYDM